MGLGREEDKQLAQQLRLCAVELGMSPALGGDVRVEFEPRTTVLVGKNGVGKSAILERIAKAFLNVWAAPQFPRPDPGAFACDIDWAGKSIRYQCRWRPSEESEAGEDNPAASIPIFDEVCAQAGSEEFFWRVEDGVVSTPHDTEWPIPVGRSLINMRLSGRYSGSYPDIAGALFEWFSSVTSIGAGLLRGGTDRESLILDYTAPAQTRAATRNKYPRLEWLAYRLVRWHQEFRVQFDEVVALGRRVQLFEDIAVKFYVESGRDEDSQGKKSFCAVFIDGVNIGLLSDGTLRALEILHALVNPEYKLVLIDEPESAAHPGLLARLLAEIDAYSIDRQILISTQSQQVVNWAQPAAIRLVERAEGVTSARRLDEAMLARVERYLHDDDTLSDFIYGGGLDE
ncbi:MAG: AAA family ATPase [Deltaproteobacteria bacterium]|nr:AAA family ATPase [Deltaproteobacteria bacterium]